MVSLGLWAAFILLDEVLLIFGTGVEATHLRLLIAELLTLVLLRLGGSSEQAMDARPQPTRLPRPGSWAAGAPRWTGSGGGGRPEPPAR